MKTSLEFYSLFCDKRFRKVSDLIQDGFKGLFFVLKVLETNDNEVTAGDISLKIGVSTARTAVILNTLESKGYITKGKSNSDARKTIVKLTNEGLIALNKRKSEVIASIDDFLLTLDEEDREQLYLLLHKVLKD